MLLKILLKFLPALIPIAIYIIWFFSKKIIAKIKAKKAKKIIIIEGEKITETSGSNHQSNDYDFNRKFFDFNDKKFLFTIYLSLIMIILCMIILAFQIQ